MMSGLNRSVPCGGGTTGWGAVTLPYDMGNAGDLLKHGVLAEFAHWQCGLGLPLRFMDPFAGEPWGRPVPEVERRVRALRPSALHAAQSDIEEGRYYGSSLLVRRAGEAAGGGTVRVFSGDTCATRRERLRARGLSMLDETISGVGAGTARDRHDGYAAFESIVRDAREGDLVLIDPFFDDSEAAGGGTVRSGERARTVAVRTARDRHDG